MFVFILYSICGDDANFISKKQHVNYKIKNYSKLTRKYGEVLKIEGISFKILLEKF